MNMRVARVVSSSILFGLILQVVAPLDLNSAAEQLCTPFGDQPNPNGATVVNEDSLWCGTGLRVGGDLSVGSPSGYIDFTLENGAVQVDGDLLVGDGSSLKPVNLTISNFTLYFTLPATQFLIDWVPDSVAPTGSIVLINDGSHLQGNISDSNTQPLGLRIKSGSTGYRLHTVKLEDTKFTNLGNYWGQGQAALDTYLFGPKWLGATWSKFTPDSYFTRLNFTNPTGMNGNPADDPVAVLIGDSLPITHSEFYGGFMGAGFTKWQWDNRYHSVCRDSYNPGPPNALLMNNTYILGDEGGGCKNIDFFQSYTTFRNNTLYDVGMNMGDGGADYNVVENSTFEGSGAGCNLASGQYHAIRNTTFNGGGTDALVWMRCWGANVTDVEITILAPDRGGLVIQQHPSEPGLIYEDAWVENVTIKTCGRGAGQLKACFQLRKYDSSYVGGLDVQGNARDPGMTINWGVYLDTVTDTTLVNTRIDEVSRAYQVQESRNVTLQNTTFGNVGLEYYLDDSTDIVVKDQAIDVSSVRLESVTSPSLVTWHWTTLVPLSLYNITRTAGSFVENYSLSTDASGTGQVSIINPTGAVYFYSLVFLNGTGPPPNDTTPPAQVTDLQAVDVGSDYAVLGWTAPGDDGNAGQANLYDVRYSLTGPLTETNFGSGTAVPVGPPQPAGSAETLNVTGLAPQTTYWFALRTADEVPNWSPVSNAVSLQTPPPPSPPDTVPPVVAFTVPMDGATVSGDVNVTVDASDDVGVVEVRLLVNGTLAATLTAPPYTWPWPTGGLSPGPYALGAEAYDLAGNQGSAQILVTVEVPASPDPNATGIAPVVEAIWSTPSEARLDITFSRPMNRTAVEQALQIDPSVPFDILWTDGTHLRLQFTEPLADGTTYVLTVRPTATDEDGTPLAEGFTFRFQSVNTSTDRTLLPVFLLGATGVVAAACVMAFGLLLRRRRTLKSLESVVRSTLAEAEKALREGDHLAALNLAVVARVIGETTLGALSSRIR